METKLKLLLRVKKKLIKSINVFVIIPEKNDRNSLSDDRYPCKLETQYHVVCKFPQTDAVLSGGTSWPVAFNSFPRICLSITISPTL